MCGRPALGALRMRAELTRAMADGGLAETHLLTSAVLTWRKQPPWPELKAAPTGQLSERGPPVTSSTKPV